MLTGNANTTFSLKKHNDKKLNESISFQENIEQK